MSGSERLEHLFMLGCMALGIICIQILWDTLKGLVVNPNNILEILLLILALLGLAFSVLVVGAFMYRLDRNAGRIKQPNRLLERIIGEGENL